MPWGRKTKLLALALVPLRGGASLADTSQKLGGAQMARTPPRPGTSGIGREYAGGLVPNR
jgi:hypothetical protein